MIWTGERNAEQGQLVTRLYEAAGQVPCDRQAIMAAGLPGADRRGTVSGAGADLSRYLAVSVGLVLEQMAASGLIPASSRKRLAILLAAASSATSGMNAASSQ